VKRRLAATAIAVVLIAAVAATLLVTGVLPNPFHSDVSRAAAAEKAAAYVSGHFPRLKDSSVYMADDSQSDAWHFGYRTERTLSDGTTTEQVPFIVIVSVDKKTGELSVAETN
jgi:hypothetical protein